MLVRKTVTTTASTQEKLDFMLKLPDGGQGATHVVNYKTQDFAAEVKSVTSGHGADVVVDFVGQSHWHKNIDVLAVDGRMTLVSFLSGKLLCQSAPSAFRVRICIRPPWFRRVIAPLHVLHIRCFISYWLQAILECEFFPPSRSTPISRAAAREARSASGDRDMNMVEIGAIGWVDRGIEGRGASRRTPLSVRRVAFPPRPSIIIISASGRLAMVESTDLRGSIFSRAPMDLVLCSFEVSVALMVLMWPYYD